MSVDSRNLRRLLMLRNQYVRDLAWILFSPPLMEIDRQFIPAELNWQWFVDLDSRPEKLIAHLNSKNLRMLGPYFEALWEFYLTRYPGNQLLLKNIQVFDSKVTLGEFDLVFRNQPLGVTYHLEVAIKYYLGYDWSNDDDFATRLGSAIRPNSRAPIGGVFQSDPSEPWSEDSLMKGRLDSPQHCWLGPGTRDRLDIKLNKMIEQQSNLSATNAGKALLEENDIPEVSARICLLGYLFYPWGQSMPAPRNCGPEHNRGIWLRLSQFAELSGAGKRWRIMDKPHWLAPLTVDSEMLMSDQQIQERLKNYFCAEYRPILLGEFALISESSCNEKSHHNGMLQNDISYYYGRESGFALQTLVFVVSENWPLSNYQK